MGFGPRVGSLHRLASPSNRRPRFLLGLSRDLLAALLRCYPRPVAGCWFPSAWSTDGRQQPEQPLERRCPRLSPVRRAVYPGDSRSYR